MCQDGDNASDEWTQARAWREWCADHICRVNYCLNKTLPLHCFASRSKYVLSWFEFLLHTNNPCFEGSGQQWPAVASLENKRWQHYDDGIQWVSTPPSWDDKVRIRRVWLMISIFLLTQTKNVNLSKRLSCCFPMNLVYTINCEILLKTQTRLNFPSRCKYYQISPSSVP